MSLMDLVSQFGGASAINQIATKVGLSPEQAQSAMSALMPSFAGAMKDHVHDDALTGTLAAPPHAPDAAATQTGIDHGNNILGQLFGSKDGSRAVAADAASRTGIGVDQIKTLLPMLATLAGAALASRAGATTAGSSSGIGGLLGMLNQGGTASPMTEIIGAAGKFLGR